MNSLATEWLINKTRYFFIVFFAIAGFSSYRGGSSFESWMGILATSFVFLIVAIINQVFINKKIYSLKLIYFSVTTEIFLVFILKYLMHFDVRVGYGMTIKEPGTFIVYFLFLIMTALRYNKPLNIYAGSLAIATYIGLLFLAIFDGGMVITTNVTGAFDKDSIRMSTEIPKLLFLGAFIFFIYKMADFTEKNMEELREAEKNTQKDFLKMKDLLATVETTANELREGSTRLTQSSGSITGIIKESGVLITEVEKISTSISTSIDEIRKKSDIQYTTVEENFSRIKEISGLMDQILNDSTRQGANADEALKLATINEKNIEDTIRSIVNMKENSKKIEEISQTISEIADKTSLLSLNAAIESARAGEHGKGFAVVADEISKLATMSIDSSKEIASIIRNTVNNIENASMMIENLSSYLGSIITFVKDNSGFMQGLKENTAREFAVSRALYDSTVEVEKAARDVKDRTEMQAGLVAEIIGWMDKMKLMAGDVAVSLRTLRELSLSLEERSVGMQSIFKRHEN